MSYEEPSSHIAKVLADRLTATLPSLCMQRYGGPVLRFRVVVPEDAPSTLHVHARRRQSDVSSLEAECTVQHVGGNVYDVRAVIEGGPTVSFAYCLPDPAPVLALETPHLARQTATVLLDALERRVGHALLSETAQGRSPSFRQPSSTTTSTPPPTRP